VVFYTEEDCFYNFDYIYIFQRREFDKYKERGMNFSGYRVT
jgi:hypothetical protein